MDSKAKTRLFQLKTHRDRLLAGAADISLSQVMDSSACQTILSQCVAYRERIYTPFQTVFTFIKQVLHPDKSCRHAVAGVVVEHTALKNKTVSSTYRLLLQGKVSVTRIRGKSISDRNGNIVFKKSTASMEGLWS